MNLFFIIGAQKAGTTALHSYLTQNPQLTLSSPKELHLFDNESIDWTKPNYKYFEERLGISKGRYCGEATPIYIYWPGSIERLYAFAPSAKIIVLLRHPVFRAFSHWKMEVARKFDSLPFSIAIREGRARVRNAQDRVHRVFSYVERGFYAEQLSRLFNQYPKSQVFITTTDKLWDEAATTLSDIEKFLGVRGGINYEKAYISPSLNRSSIELNREDFFYLMKIFSPEIRTTEEITGLDLRNWLDSDFRESEKIL